MKIRNLIYHDVKDEGAIGDTVPDTIISQSSYLDSLRLFYHKPRIFIIDNGKETFV